MAKEVVVTKQVKKLSIQKIANINQACALVGDNDVLDSKVAYRIGRLGDFSESIIKRMQKIQQKKINTFREANEKLTDAEKAKANDKLTEEMNQLLEEEEEITIPPFKYSDFIADEDIKVHGKEFKKGQLLVPVKFFSLMGDTVVDDEKLLG